MDISEEIQNDFETVLNLIIQGKLAQVGDTEETLYFILLAFHKATRRMLRDWCENFGDKEEAIFSKITEPKLDEAA